MFFKSLLMGASCAVVAGAVVYFGTLQGPESIAHTPRVKSESVANSTAVSEAADIPSNTPSENSDSAPAQKPSVEIEPTEKNKIFSFRGKDKVEQPSKQTRPTIPANERASAADNIALAMREIEKIEADDISEQAYFSLANYAMSEGRFYDAEIAINRIKTVEMKETARIRMAIAFARAGQADEAFAVVDAVEAPEYRDILRLQVVEALGTKKGEETRP